MTATAAQVLGRDLPPPPLGNCEIPIVQGYLTKIRAGHRVMEVGCGSWSSVRDHCVTVDANYDGIDVLTENSVATRFENLAELSFPDDSFDFVIATQSMEHWAEYGCSLRWGLWQIFRVCRPGGTVMLNFPIHFHGTKTFMMGRLDRLSTLFAPFSDDVRWEHWGDPSTPMEPCYPHPGFLPLRNRPAYVMDVQAVKDRPLPSGYDNSEGRTGRLAKLWIKPPTFALYGAARRIGLAPPPLVRS